MTSTAIDEDLEEKERRVSLLGFFVGVLGFVLISRGYSGYLPATLFTIIFVYQLVQSLSEIEVRGRAITKFRERPSRMREVLADLEHEQWVKLTKYYANQDDQIQVSEEKLDYWKDLWVDYEELSEDMKDKDRKYADKVIEKLEEADYYGA